MSEADYLSDGGYYANQDFYAEECSEYDGNCKKCPYEYNCDSSEYNRNRIEMWKRERN